MPGIACEAANIHAAGSGRKQRAVKHASSLLVKMHLWAIQEFSIYSKAVLEARPQLRSVAHKHTALLSVHFGERRYDCILHHIAGVLYQ